MPLIRVPITSAGAIMDIYIGISQPHEALMLATGKSFASPFPVRALIDTGSTCTCVSADVVRRLGAQSSGTSYIATSTTGSNYVECLDYDTSLWFLNEDESKHRFGAVRATEVEISGDSYDALIGRDILDQCVLLYDAKAGFCMVMY